MRRGLIVLASAASVYAVLRLVGPRGDGIVGVVDSTKAALNKTADTVAKIGLSLAL